jgi:prolyl oligopeptidase
MSTGTRYTLLWSVTALSALLAACVTQSVSTSSRESNSLRYPDTPRGEVSDDYHGAKIPDPYRWLEQPDSTATREWVQAENAVALPYLQALPQRAWLAQRLKALWTYERFGLPHREAGKYFYLRNDGTQDQSVLYVADSLDGAPRVMFDPNLTRDDATISLSAWQPSPKGTLLAYGLSDAGSDWDIWRFRRVDNGADLADEIKFTKFAGVEWARDESGVYYSRYPLKRGETAAQATRGDDAGRPDIYFHRIGEPQSADRLVYRVADHPTRVPSAQITDDGRYLLINLFEGYETNAVLLVDLAKPGSAPRPLFTAWDALYNVIGSRGDEFFVYTTQGAPRGRVISVNVNDPAPARWRDVAPHGELAINNASFIGGRVIVGYIRDASSVVRLFEANGTPAGEVKLPGFGTATGFGGRGDDSESFFSYSDYLSPARVMRFDAARNASSEFRAPKVPADFAPYITEQVFYTSKDGTRVPMFITRRRDAPRNGDLPTLLYGYGGFNVTLQPSFSPSIHAWLELGGAYAVANLRGGGEYGEDWHQAGTKARKQNVFDDFIAAAEYLIREKYTRRERLAILGRSNGGLLVAAVLTQRPDLFGAALPAVGVLDMLRYHTASANARQWSSDYGLAENADDFAFLRAYSPVHNVRPGVCYPPTLVTTADHDDRVVPWHSYKFAAELQRAQACPNPVLIRVETRAGHGAGKPVWMQIEDIADQFGFVANALGMTAPAPPGGAVAAK